MTTQEQHQIIPAANVADLQKKIDKVADTVFEAEKERKTYKEVVIKMLYDIQEDADRLNIPYHELRRMLYETFSARGSSGIVISESYLRRLTPREWKETEHTRHDQIAGTVTSTRLKGGLREVVQEQSLVLKRQQEGEELARLRLENNELRESNGRLNKQIETLRQGVVPESIEKWTTTTILHFRNNQFPIICHVDPLRKKIDLEMDEVQIKSAITKELSKDKKK